MSMREILLWVLVVCILFAVLGLTGCNEWMVQPDSVIGPVQLVEPTLVDALVDTVSALTVANTASTPVNPYAAPIGVGLAGLIGMLEALRRKERSARKHAEQNNNATGKTGKAGTSQLASGCS